MWKILVLWLVWNYRMHSDAVAVYTCCHCGLNHKLRLRFHPVSKIFNCWKEKRIWPTFQFSDSLSCLTGFGFNFLYNIVIKRSLLVNSRKHRWIIIIYDLLTDWLTDWLNEWMNEWKNEWMNEWMNKWMNVWMNEWMNEWVSKWMYE